MRSDMETARELGPTPGSPLVRRELLAVESVRVYRLQGAPKEPVTRTKDIGKDRHYLTIGLSGTVVFYGSIGRGPRVHAGESVVYYAGPCASKIYFARGVHDRIEFEWDTADAGALNGWVRHRPGVSLYSGWVASTSLMGLDLRYKKSIEWALNRLRDGAPESVGAVLACMHELVGAAMTASSASCLAEVSETAAEPLRILMAAVKQNPTAPWSLREAAAFAGYSPFHLSRTFRAVMDFGFPEFVDRCRAELAITKLLRPEQSIDDVASSCGFGSTQALREACKEYLGMLPSEIRNLPMEVSDFR